MAHVNFSPAVDEIRGKAGTDVFTKSKTGPILRRRAQPANPRTAAQNAVRSNLARAAETFKNLTPAQAAPWAGYALTVTRHHPVTGRAYHPSSVAAFSALATKFLQVNPTGAIPLTPPAAAFAGDGIAVTATGAAGQVSFTASGANAANVRTELLLQALASRKRTPTPHGYRTKTFVAFAAGALSSNVAVPAGFYAPAYRFVNAQTGQETLLVTLSTVQVT
jgi:hypothetical protein